MEKDTSHSASAFREDIKATTDLPTCHVHMWLTLGHSFSFFFYSSYPPLLLFISLTCASKAELILFYSILFHDDSLLGYTY
jgi:hypothetical protein